MTPFADLQSTVGGSSRARQLASVALLIAAAAILVSACSLIAPGATLAPGATPTPAPTATPQLPLTPAPLHADPFSLIVWISTPLFQVLFLLLVALSKVTPDMGVAIIVMTLIVRTLLVPLIRRQMVSTRRMQALAPEIKEIQRRYKGDRMKQQQATSELYKERGISQFGCMSAILPMLIIIPMYTVIRDGLQSYDPTPMLRVFGVQLMSLTCTGTGVPDALNHIKPCLPTTVAWLGNLDVSQPSTVSIFGFGLSGLAVVYTLIQLVASRMALPPHDPAMPLDANARTQRQTMLFLPLISILYGGIIPVGLYLYLIVSTVYQIVQQFLTTGWGGMFPLFGWTPSFAVGHTPRFPVAGPAPNLSTRAAGASAPATPTRSSAQRAASAAATVRQGQRGRQGRRGRRR